MFGSSYPPPGYASAVVSGEDRNFNGIHDVLEAPPLGLSASYSPPPLASYDLGDTRYELDTTGMVKNAILGVGAALTVQMKEEIRATNTVLWADVKQYLSTFQESLHQDLLRGGDSNDKEQQQLRLAMSTVARNLENFGRSLQQLRSDLDRRLDQDRLEYSKINKFLNDHKDEIAGHFDAVHRKVEESKVDKDLQKALKLLEDRKGDPGAIQAAIDKIHKGLNDHRDELHGHFDKVHKKVEGTKVDDDLRKAMKDLEKGDPASLKDAMDEIHMALGNHHDELQKRFESVHKKVDDNISEVLRNVRVLKNVRDVKGDIKSIKDAISVIQQQAKDQKGQFDELKQALMQAADVSGYKRDELQNVNEALACVQRTLKHQKEDLGTSFDRFNKKVDESKEESRRNLQDNFSKLRQENGLQFGRLEDAMKSKGDDTSINNAMNDALKLHLSELGVYFDKVHTSILNGRVELDLSQVMRVLEMHETELSTINAVSKTLKDMPQQLDSIERTAVQIISIVDPIREQLEGHMRRVYDQFKATKDRLDDFVRQSDKVQDDHHLELCGKLTGLDKKDAGIDKAMDEVKKAVKDHHQELCGKLTDLDKKDVGIDKAMDEVKKAMKDQQIELGGKYERIHSNQDYFLKQMFGLLTRMSEDCKKVDSVAASLERLQQTMDQVKNCSTENERNILEIDGTLKKHFVN